MSGGLREAKETKLDRIVVTGCGICSAIGNSTDEVVRSLRSGKSNARKITRFTSDPFQTKIAAEVELEEAILPTEAQRDEWDRGTLMAIIASRQAIQQSRIECSRRLPIRVGVATGVSGSGQFQTARVDAKRQLIVNRRTAEVILEKNVPNYQAEQISDYFGLTGPQTTVSSASAGSGIAISIAMRWLQSNRCDAVLAGGSECLSVLNIIGFDVLGITSPKECQPFSASSGMMMGEGAGYLMFEREESALTRGANILGYADGIAVSADAFDPVLFDPTGDGQQRAMRRALKDGNATKSQVDWLRASGSGGRDQDSAELIAIKELFGDQVPPVSSLEPFFGHCNGAGPAIGMVAALSSMNAQLLPPTLNFDMNSEIVGEIDFVPNESRKSTVQRTLCNSAAFGGTNVAILCSKYGSDRQCRLDEDIVITGVGTVSALGAGGRESIEILASRKTGIAEHDRFDMPDGAANISGLVRNLKARKLLPQLNMRGVDLLAQYAAVAAKLAWNDAGIEPERHESDRLGVVSGIAHASGKTMQRLMNEIYREYRRPTIGKVMLRNGRFMVTSQLAHWFSLKGYNSTLACSEVSGLHALGTAADQLRHDDSLDALLVVASDEVSPMYTQLHLESECLLRTDGCMSPYNSSSTGRVLGEGAVAMILERATFAENRNAPVLGRIAGQAMSYEPNSEHQLLDNTIQLALKDASVDASEVTAAMGLGTGNWSHDRIELDSIKRCFGYDRDLVSFSGHTGFMTSASGLLAVVGAIASLQGADLGTLSVSAEGGPLNAYHDRVTTFDSHCHSSSIAVGRGHRGHQFAMVIDR